MNICHVSELIAHDKRAAQVVIAISIIILLVSGSPILAMPTDRTFRPQGGAGVWNLAGNWDPPGIPSSADLAIIPGETICDLDGQDGEALKIEIEGLTTSAFGTLIIPKGSTLTLHGSGSANASIVDGIIRFETGGGATVPELYVSGNHLFKKTTSSSILNIIGADSLHAASEYGLIRGAQNAKLTLNTRGVASEPRIGMLGNFRIEVAMENNGDVNARPEDPANYTAEIQLVNEAKLGTGLWKATNGELVVDASVSDHGRWVAGTAGTIAINSPVSNDIGLPISGFFEAVYTGKILVKAAVSGSAPWTLKADGDNADPLIHFDYPCTGLSGNVFIHAGTLRFDDPFCTTGEFDGDGGKIIVGAASPAIVVKFSQGCP